MIIPGGNMIAKDLMSKNVQLTSPNENLKNVIRIMEDECLGSLPVAENDRLIGMITDRDIALRAFTNPNKKTVREVMSNEVHYCFEDQNLIDVVTSMGKFNIRRMPVLNRAKRLVGILSLSDLTKSSQAWKETNEIVSHYHLAI